LSAMRMGGLQPEVAPHTLRNVMPGLVPGTHAAESFNLK
jgi:hypothetical protein